VCQLINAQGSRFIDCVESFYPLAVQLTRNTKSGNQMYRYFSKDSNLWGYYTMSAGKYLPTFKILEGW